MIKFHDAKRRIEFAQLKKEIGAEQFEIEKGCDDDDDGESKSNSSLKKLKKLSSKDKWSKPLLKGLKFLQKDS